MDAMKRKLFIKNEIKKQFLTSIKHSKTVTFSRRYQATYYLSKLPKLSSVTQIRNRCVLSGRVWSVNSRTRYGRFTLRENAYASNIPGLSRAS